MYDTTTGGLSNAGLADGSATSREDVERTREALEDVRTTGPGRIRRIGSSARRIGSSARRPAAVTAAALFLVGAAATAVLLRRRAAAKRTGWNRVLPGFLKR
jgi:hypothetical protein